MFVVLKSIHRCTAPKTERNGFGQVKLLVSSSKPMTLRLPSSMMLIAKATHFHRHHLRQFAREIATCTPAPP